MSGRWGWITLVLCFCAQTAGAVELARVGPVLQKTRLLLFKDDKPFDFAQAGKDYDVKVVSFWASWCEYCQEEMQDLKELSKSENYKKALFVAVNIADPLPQAKAFMAKTKVDFPVVYAPGDSLKKQLNLPKLPFVVIFDRQGNAISAYSGYSRERFVLMRKRVGAELSGAGAEE